jgi:hypothetical protein
VEVKIKVSVKKKIKRWRFIGLKVIDWLVRWWISFGGNGNFRYLKVLEVVEVILEECILK